MSDQKDDSSGLVLMVLAGIVALVLAGVIGLAVGSARRHADRQPAAPATVFAASATDAAIVFAPGSSVLPPGASATLVRLADTLRAESGLVASLAGAREPVLAVRHALEANGVTADRLTIAPPPAELGENRVEVHLR